MLQAVANIRLWLVDPVQFVRDQFGVEPDDWQKDFLIAYNTHQRVAAKACKGPGKTTVLAWCAWHFLACHPHAKVPATSISGDNLRDGLWAEMSKWQQRSPFLQAAFEWQKERIIANDHPETWFMAARKWAKDANSEQQANTLAGLHADYILFILDEAGGIPASVMAAAEAALATGIKCKLLICGNPTHLSGPLYSACTKERSLWHVIEITGDPDDPKRSPRISVQWAREMIQKYGRDHPYVMVNVLGKFPPASFNAILGPDDMAAASARVVPISAIEESPRILGCDIGLQGDDPSVIAPRQGLVGFKPKILRLADPKDIAGVIARAIESWKPDAVNIDNSGGYGSGVISYLRDWGYAVTDIQFAGKPNDAQFLNKRAEMLWLFAAWVKGGGALPELPEMTEEATAITYFHKRDKLQMIEKALVKELIGRSTNLMDAYALTFAHPVVKAVPFLSMAPEYHPLMESQPQPVIDLYNPFA